MKFVTIVLLLPACLVLAGGTAFADQMLIKYRSGKVQTLLLDEPSSTIAGISYQDDSVSAADPSSSGPVRAGVKGPANKAEAPTHKSTGTPQTIGKPAVRLEWAHPLEGE